MNKCCRETAKKTFDEIEKETKSLGIEKLAKEYPDFVHYITFNYNNWKKIKKRILSDKNEKN